MSGWCPRCDAVRDSEGTCPQCQAPLVELDDRPVRPPAKREEPAATEVGAVVEQPPRGRLRVALAVAALVLVGLAFVAGRGTGGAAATAQRSTSTSTTQTTTPPAVELERQLGWRSRPSDGVSVEVVSINRIPSDPANGAAADSDNSGSLSLLVHGLDGDRRLLALTGLRLVDSGGGEFAAPETMTIDGEEAVPARPSSQPDRYVIDLGPIPSVDTLQSIQFDGLLVSASADGGAQLRLASDGAWPARPPLRSVEPSPDSLDVPLARADGSSSSFPLRVASAFVGAGRVLVVLSFDEEIAGRDLGIFPVSASLRDGNRLVCSRQTIVGEGPSRVSPLLTVDCPASPATSLTVQVAAGVSAVPARAKLPG
jgi:hypothetical protein